MLLSAGLSETIIQGAQSSHYSPTVVQVWLWFLKTTVCRGQGVSQWTECIPIVKEAQDSVSKTSWKVGLVMYACDFSTWGKKQDIQEVLRSSRTSSSQPGLCEACQDRVREKGGESASGIFLNHFLLVF